MSGKHRRGKHRAYNPRVGPVVAGAVGVGALIGTASLLMTAGAHADPGGVNWDAVASCESGGRWNINTGNGFLGGLQWTQATWRANGGTGNPAGASREQQIAVANHVIATQGLARGLANWPVCGKHASSPAPVSAKVSAPKHAAAPAPPAVPAAPALPAFTGTTTDYVVNSGDTLAAIADAQHVAGGWQQIAAANQATVPDPDQIRVGQHLKLPVAAETVYPLGQPQPVKFSTPEPELKAFTAPAPAAVTTQATSGGVAARAVTAALGMVGQPYRWGGVGNGGVDCSGLIMTSFAKAGVTLPRVAAAQATMGKPVKLADIRAGDTLFYAYGNGVSHVALAIGGGMLVEASQPGHPVATRHIYTSNLVAIRRIA